MSVGGTTVGSTGRGVGAAVVSTKVTTSTALLSNGAANSTAKFGTSEIAAHLYPPVPRPASVVLSVVLVNGSTTNTPSACKGAANNLERANAMDCHFWVFGPDPNPASVVVSVVLATGSIISTASAL